MSESRFVTILGVPEESREEVERLFESIADRDETWRWAFKVVDDALKVVVYSRGKNQAKQRGRWLVEKTDLFKGSEFRTTHLISLKTALKERPRKKDVVNLRVLLKRKRLWKKAEGRGE